MGRRIGALALILTAACGDSGGVTTVPTTGTATTVAQATTTTGAEPDGVIEITLTTADGLNLEGLLYTSEDESAMVVLGHMRPADMTSYLELAELIHADGHSVLLYNNRGYGRSEGVREQFALIADAEAALAFARERGAIHIVYGGSSMNGATALVLGANHDLAGLFTLSGVLSFPSVGDVGGLLPSITEPALFVAAEDDGTAAADALAMTVGVGGGGAAEIYPTGGHATAMFDDNPGLFDVILEFLRIVLG